MGYSLPAFSSGTTKYDRSFFLVLVVAAYLVLQFIYLGHRWVADESWYLMPIPSISDGEFRIPVIPGFESFWPAPPLLTYLEYLINLLMPLTNTVARLLPLAAGTAVVYLVYRFSTLLFNRTVGVWAAFYTAADNLIFLTSRTVRPDIFVPFYIAGTLLALACYMREGKGQHYLLLAGLCVGLGISTHPNGFIAPLSGLIFLCMNPHFSASRFRLFLNYSVYCGVFLIPLVLWFVWFDADTGFAHFRQTWLGSYGRHADTGGGFFQGIAALFSSEIAGRYTDFIQFPFRIHIAVISLLSVVAGFMQKDRQVKMLSTLVVAQLLFFTFISNSNDSVRYLASLTPFIAILVAWFTCRFYQPGENGQLPSSHFNLPTLTSLAFVGLMGVSQWAGNALFLWQNRDADYSRVITEVRNLLPEGDNRIYGEISFWMGLNDSFFVPYIRTSWQRAVTLYQPNIVIMDDWVMVGGYNDDDYSELRSELKSEMAEHGKLLGIVAGGFYGDLKIYQVDTSSNPFVVD